VQEDGIYKKNFKSRFQQIQLSIADTVCLLTTMDYITGKILKMVNQETIRKGSKVFFADTKDNPVTVLDNTDGKILVQVGNIVPADASELYPVPLTPEMIKRCSFLKTDEFVFEHPEDEIELEYDYQGVTHMRFNGSDSTIQLTALHELQHAYWVITNKELAFK